MYREQQTIWIMTFSDLLVILLTMFVLQLSMSTFDTESLTEKLDHIGGHYSENAAKEHQARLSKSNNAPPSEHALSLLVERLKDTLGSQHGISMKFLPRENCIELTLEEGLFFAGSNELSFFGVEVISEIARDTKDLQIDINYSVKGNSWKSARELAAVLHRQFIDAGVEHQSVSAFVIPAGDGQNIGSNQLFIRLSHFQKTEMRNPSPSEGL